MLSTYHTCMTKSYSKRAHAFIAELATCTTVFTRSDTAATIYFIARVCAAFIRERHLLIPVAAGEAIHRVMVDCPFADVEEG